jgi:hypothetical protein
MVTASNTVFRVCAAGNEHRNTAQLGPGFSQCRRSIAIVGRHRCGVSLLTLARYPYT